MSNRPQNFKQGDRYELRWWAGDVFTLRCTLTDDQGDAIDLTGVGAVFSGRISSHDATPAFSIDGDTVGTATNGIVDFDVDSTVTGSVREYLAEIRVHGLTGSEVECLVQFKLIILPADQD